MRTAVRRFLPITFGALLVLVAIGWNWLTAQGARRRIFEGSRLCPIVPDDVEVAGGGIYVDSFPPSITCVLSDSGGGWKEELVTLNAGAGWLFWIGSLLIAVGLIMVVAIVVTARIHSLRRRASSLD